MKNITPQLADSPNFRLSTARVVRLDQKIWNGYPLAGHYWRFYWNDRGGAGLRRNGQKIEISPDHFYILPPECGLCTWCRADDPPRQFYVHFEMTRLNKNPDLHFRFFSVRSGEKDLLEQILSALEKTSASESPYLQLQIMALVSGVLARMDEHDFQPFHSDMMIERLCADIREDPGRERTIAALAAECGLPVNSFLKKFRAATGFSPYRYILNQRYALAARLLEETQMTIDAICEQVGFRDRFHFSREFKKVYGIPPGGYRISAASCGHGFKRAQ